MDLIQIILSIGLTVTVIALVYTMWSSRNRIQTLQNQLGDERNDSVRQKVLADERLSSLQELQTKLDAAVNAKERLLGEVAGLNTLLADERIATQEKIDLLTELRSSMAAEFKDVTREALKSQGEEFTKTNVEKVAATIEPYKKQIEVIKSDLSDINLEAVKDRAALKTQIETLSKDSQELARALKTDQKKQGAWGEMVLERILEHSGLRKGHEYEVQAPRKGEEGQALRPDVVVKLSEDKTLVIDSKVSLTAYTEAVSADSDEERASAIKRHVKSVQTHIDGLSGKAYQLSENRTVDYVVLFLPYESALSSTLNEKNDIVSYAYERNIMIATPTTLLMALRTVAHVWSTEQRNKNADEIASRAGRLYDKLSNFIDTFTKASEKLDQARTAFNKAEGQLRSGHGNVIAQAQTLRTLGAKTTKSINLVHDSDEEITVDSGTPLSTDLPNPLVPSRKPYAPPPLSAPHNKKTTR